MCTKKLQICICCMVCERLKMQTALLEVQESSRSHSHMRTVANVSKLDQSINILHVGITCFGSVKLYNYGVINYGDISLFPKYTYSIKRKL